MAKRRVRELRKRYPGCVFEFTKKGHIRIVLPNGEKVHTSVSPSDWRTDKNLEKHMRSAGYYEE